MEEEWRDVIGYEGLYQVSNLGRVKSLNYNHTGEEGILSPSRAGKGYFRVKLWKNREKEYFLVHRLVAITFIPNPNNLPQVNHKDENKSNNAVNNLEWCTAEYNSNYGTRNKRAGQTFSVKFSGDKSPRAKKVRCITTGEIFTTIKEAGELYNINKSHISACCKGKRKSAGKHPITGKKLVWEYVE